MVDGTWGNREQLNINVAMYIRCIYLDNEAYLNHFHTGDALIYSNLL